jgi:hypothetical protein
MPQAKPSLRQLHSLETLLDKQSHRRRRASIPSVVDVGIANDFTMTDTQFLPFL